VRFLRAACLFVLFFAPLANAWAGTSLFGSSERFSPDLSRFSEWDRLIARADAEARKVEAPCTAAPSEACTALWWRTFVSGLAALPLRARVERVNAALNRVPYVAAAANGRDPDQWLTPLEFLAHGGQSQDYAFAKFLALEQSGVPESALRLVVVHDAKTGADHAVTVVYVEGTPLVLDNQAAEVVPAAPGRYAPYFSINRTGWWYHRPPGPAEIADAAASSAR
jgi:predicted transglutaminase-like cysteine proteinase